MISIFLFKVMFIFLPGLIATTLIRFSNSKPNEVFSHEWIIYSFIIGNLSYLILNIFIPVNIFDLYLNSNIIITNPSEVASSILVGIILSIIIIWIKDKEILHFFCRKFRLSSRIGNKYILENIYTTTDPEISIYKNSWVNLQFRDGKSNFIGLVKNCGYVDFKLEILLIDVDVYYNGKTKPSYSKPAVYFCLNPDEVYIEFH